MSQDCIDKTGDVTKSGFGTWCINLPNDTRSFIFTVGGGYNELNLEDCIIFLPAHNDSTRKQVGRSKRPWMEGKLSSTGKKIASACVQCRRIFS